jgi:large conductance mechanosensitive channel
MLKEFKEFVMRGNVIDMAVGIVVGIAFGKIITSLVNDVIMPPIGLLLGKVDFSNLVITLRTQTAQSAAVTIKYGAFINTIINFIIIAFVMFIVIRQANHLTKFGQKPTESATKDCPYCYTKIPVKASRCSGCTATL